MAIGRIDGYLGNAAGGCHVISADTENENERGHLGCLARVDVDTVISSMPCFQGTCVKLVG